MRITDLNNTGTLRSPVNWIILNPLASRHCREAYVIEMRHSAKYGIPHFVYLTNTRSANEINEEEIYRLCCEAWPSFQEKVLNKQVKHIPGVNDEEWWASPGIWISRIDEYEGDSIDNYPCGAMIIRW